MTHTEGKRGVLLMKQKPTVNETVQAGALAMTGFETFYYNVRTDFLSNLSANKPRIK